MENIELIILTIVVILCFVTFFISTFNEFEKVEKKNLTSENSRGILSRFLAYLESLVAD
ncbi:hypothetical protein SAMN04488062_107129 [Flavobacterium omnivorum]|uniref:Uncharacterized protein n=1 Tax=Flavobacterium omnivorum TaxID=178355 RepID=A0A1G8CDR1_9FLAO|nr:hypothetical protein [Flavobacterium omnivorum]MBC7747714.1 hypothetical protein [Flavobacterium sp.]SDH43594.1 hypothetical protein SAMN04488062_107129 [Flavobacterium omnivorum]